jgi:hypothetical protein
LTGKDIAVKSSTKIRDVAQSGSAPEWGSGGREFKSRRPDHFFSQKEQLRNDLCCSFLFETLILPVFVAYAFAASRLNQASLRNVAPEISSLRH